MRALAELGLQVPDEVKVVGYHDVELARYRRPALTTVRVDRQMLAREAVRLLGVMVRGEAQGQGESAVLEAVLVVRESS